MDVTTKRTKYYTQSNPFTKGSLIYAKLFTRTKTGEQIMAEVQAEVLGNHKAGRYDIKLLNGAVSINDLINLQKKIPFVQLGHRYDKTQQNYIRLKTRGESASMGFYTGINTPQKAFDPEELPLPNTFIGNLDHIGAKIKKDEIKKYGEGSEKLTPDYLLPKGEGIYSQSYYGSGQIVLTGGKTKELIDAKIEDEDLNLKFELFKSGEMSDVSLVKRIEQATGKRGLFVGGYIDVDLINANLIFTKDIVATGSVTGVTIRTANHPDRIELSNDSFLKFFTNDKLVCTMEGRDDVSKELQIDTDILHISGSLMSYGGVWSFMSPADYGKVLITKRAHPGIGNMGAFVPSSVTVQELEKLKNNVNGTLQLADGKVAVVEGGMIKSVA